MVYQCRKVFFAALILLFLTCTSQAEEPVLPGVKQVDITEVPGRSLELGTSQIGLWGGYSPDNPTHIGRTTGRPLAEFNLRYARVIKTSDDWALKYTAEIIPVILVRQPKQGYESNGEPEDLPGRKNKIYGSGISPVGLQINFRRGCVFQPYLNMSAGILYFSDNVPVADSSNFNFTFGFGGGLEIWHLKNQSVFLGYKYQHISNGYTAPQNPGLDSNLYYAGYTWSWNR